MKIILSELFSTTSSYTVTLEKEDKNTIEAVVSLNYDVNSDSWSITDIECEEGVVQNEDIDIDKVLMLGI